VLHVAAAVGQIYIELQEEHGGVFYSLCQDDWAPVFEALSANVVGNATLPCAFEIPEPPDGVELDWNAVNFVYTPEGGDEDTIPNVGNDGACGDGAGWYYDDPAAPTAIYVPGDLRDPGRGRRPRRRRLRLRDPPRMTGAVSAPGG
jgi:hypothetical protein